MADLPLFFSQTAFANSPDHILVVKGFMESMMSKLGEGYKGSEDSPHAEPYLAVVCYQLEK